MGAPPDSWPLSLPHANIPVVPVRADQSCLVWSAVDARAWSVWASEWTE